MQDTADETVLEQLPAPRSRCNHTLMTFGGLLQDVVEPTAAEQQPAPSAAADSPPLTEVTNNHSLATDCAVPCEAAVLGSPDSSTSQDPPTTHQGKAGAPAKKSKKSGKKKIAQRQQEHGVEQEEQHTASAAVKAAAKTAKNFRNQQKKRANRRLKKAEEEERRLSMPFEEDEGPLVQQQSQAVMQVRLAALSISADACNVASVLQCCCSLDCEHALSAA